MLTSFLTADWRKLAMVNYAVPPNLLQPLVPKHTELDLFEGHCFVSLIGFLFDNVSLLGRPIPFHTTFEEVNLRFYVKHRAEDGTWKRGVTFVKEIVPKYAVSWVANAIYHEPYVTMPMRHHWENADDQLTVSYEWKKKEWHRLKLIADDTAIPMEVGSLEEFITEHYWGYTKYNASTTYEYGVEHPRWEIYPVKTQTIEVDFGAVYGSEFDFLTNQSPHSAVLAEGSAIVVKSAKKL
ncbi:YqjF family protein [Runella sp.]|uniref:YqjF family protein n=1 Tax=Runella sp. TaxID=1960881 RepID=UPI003D13F8AF